MSRIGKKEIIIPENTEVNISDSVVDVKGPLGELSLSYKPLVDIVKEDNVVKVLPKKENIETRALWGTYASIIMNMVQGVNKEYEKKLIVEGVGFKVALQGENLVLNVGFSHPVEIAIPKGIKCVVEKQDITISGIDKELVGQFAATVRAIKKPEPYKGKGIRYDGEYIRRKEGKKAV